MPSFLSSRVAAAMAALFLALASVLVVGNPASAQTGVSCDLPESDADALVVLNSFYPNKYVWTTRT